MNDWHFPRMQPMAGGVFWSQILASENIRSAWDRVRRNGGAPGVDGVSVRDLEPCFESEWPLVAKKLHGETWQPKPVRRVSLAKPDGGVRNLGIPAVMDRVVHQAIAQVMTPPWEKRFSPHSFAYRRGLGTREALTDLVSQAACGADAWHLDIRQFFDSVPHAQALRVVRRVSDEPPLVRLVQAILKAGVLSGCSLLPTSQGIPQGSPLSPLLANGVLHGFDAWLGERSLPFVRYADDIVILLPPGHTPGRWHADVVGKLALLGLTLNEGKTMHGALDELNFLGFTFFRDPHGMWRRRISAASWTALEKELCRRKTAGFALLGEDEGSAADYLTGWLAHFGITEHPEDHKRLEQLAATHRKEQFTSMPVRIRVPYDGGPARGQSAGGAAPGQRMAGLRLLLARALARRWLRAGFDFDRRRKGFLPRPTALRLTVFGFTFRLRL